METIILNNDELISQVKSNTKDIATLKSNTKWLYKYGGVGGKGSNSGTATSDPIVTANINGLYAVENGKDIPLNGTGSYTLNISVSKAGGKSFKIFGSYAPMKQSAGRPGSLGTKVVSFDAGYSVSYNITIPYNMNVSFTVDSGDGEFTKQITFGCITTPYTFNISFLQNNGVEYISPDGSLFLSNIKANGLKIKFDYSFYIKCTASYEFKQNFLIQSDNLSGNFDLTQQKEGSIIFNVPVEQYSEMNIGQYYFAANIKVTPDSSETISVDPISKNCFIIPESLFLMVYTEDENKHLYYNTRNTYYSHEIYDEYNDLINKEADKSITEEEKERLNEIKQNITFSSNGIIGMILKAYKGTKTNKTFNITKISVTDENNNTSDLVIDYSTIYEQTAYTITPNISYTGEVKLSFTLRYQNDEQTFTYYLYCVKPLSSFDWVNSNITTNYQHYYRGGEIKGGFYNAGISSIDMNSNLDDYVKLCKIPHVQLGTNFDVLINIGVQYNSINDTNKLLFDIYSDTESENASQHIYIYQNVMKYNGQDNLDIYLPQEYEFNKIDGTKYHLLSIHKHLISNNASEVDVYIDGSLEATFSSYVTDNLYFNSIDCYPANYSVNLAEIIYVPRNQNNELHDYFDDVSISQYWYKYCQVFRNNTGYNEKNITLLSSLYKLSEEENLSNNNFNISKETISDIASNVDCPVLMLSIDCHAQLNNKSFKTSWFTLSNTALRQLQVKNLYWSKGLSDLSLVNIPSDFYWYIDIQGTSSLARKIKNLTLFTEPTDGSYPNRLLFSPNFTMEDKNSFLPEEQFNLKADIVDSSHANNTSIGQFVNEHTTRFEDAQQQNAYAGHIKNCLTGFPVLLFIDEILNNELGEETHTYYYYGIFNFDLGRESYFNLGYKSTEVFNDEHFTEAVNSSNNGFITYEIPNGQNQLFNSLLVAEILENNINGQNPIGGQVFDFSQFSSEKILFGDVVSENPLVEYNGMFGKLKFSNNLGNVRGIITEFVKNIAKSGAACFKRLNKNMSDDPYYGYEYGYSKATTEDNTESLNFVPNFIYQGDRNNSIDHPYTYPIEYKNANAELLSFISDSNNYQQQLLDTICPYQGGSEEDPPHKVHLDYNSLVEYFVTCMAFGLVDSVLKNMNIKTWTANADLSNIAKWYIAFYDMDTCLGRDNKGIKTSYFAFTDYWKSNDAILDAFTIEAQKIKIYRDFYPAKLTNEEGAGYDIPSSYLFAIAKYANYIVGKTFWDGNNFNTPQDLWTKWRQPGAILENAQSFMDKYFTNHLNKIPEALISYNYRFKYIWQTNTGSFDSNELPSFHGRGTYEVLDWLIKRFHILDAYFNLCRAKDYITFYKTDTNTWENTSLTEIYPNNIAEATSNDDIVIFKSLSATNMTYTKTSLSEMTFYVKAPELTPFILYLKEGAYVYRYLLNDPNRTYKISINNAGNQDFFLGGSSEWIEFGGAQALIENNVLTCISNNLQVLSATEGTCTVWNFKLPALQSLNLTSKNYGGNLTIGYGENEVTNLVSLSSINISNSSINLNINRSNIREIIANNINSESLTIRNSNNIKRIELGNAFINNINIANNVANLIDFSSLRFNKLEINGTGPIEGSSINIIDNNVNPIKTLKLEDIENVTIQNVTQLQQLILSNDVVKKLVIINSNLKSLNETYKENEDHEEVVNSIYIENKKISSYEDENGKIIDVYERILHLEKLTNITSISFEQTLGFTKVILPNRDIKLLYKAFYQTDLTYIDYADNENPGTLILCDNGSNLEAGDDCKIFFNSRFTLLSSDKTMLHFKVQEKPTSLNELFALNRYYNSIDTHNGTPQITYPNLVKFVNGLGNKEYVTSLYRAFFRQTNICAYLYPVSNVPTENSVYLLKQNIAGEPYGSPYNEKDESDPSKLKLLSFKGYNRLTDVSECFEYCDINFMNKNLFNGINLQDGKTIKIENMFDCRNLQYIHKDTFAPISNKYRVFLFNGSMEDGYLRRCEYIRIYDDISELSEVNMHSLIFGNSDENSIVNELCGFNIINSKLNFNNLFTDKTKSITSIENVCTNIDQNNITNNICIGINNDENTFNNIGFKNLSNLSTLKNSFTCKSNISLNDIKNSNALIDIVNLFDWENQAVMLFNNDNNYNFGFYKVVDLDKDADKNSNSWDSIWKTIFNIKSLEKLDYLFANTVFKTTDENKKIEIPIIKESEDESEFVNHIKLANGLFSNSTMFVNDKETGLKLSDNTLLGLKGTLTKINRIFYGSVLCGESCYPIPGNIFNKLNSLTDIEEGFAYTIIEGSYKANRIESDLSIGKHEIIYDELDGNIYSSNTINTDLYTGNIYGYPIVPPELFNGINSLKNIKEIFAYSDFEGYIPSSLLSSNTQIETVAGLFKACKVLPQLVYTIEQPDENKIYKANSQDHIKIFVFIPSRFILSKDAQTNIQPTSGLTDLFSFYLTVSRNSNKRVYLFTEESVSLDGRFINSFTPLFHPKSTIIQQWVDDEQHVNQSLNIENDAYKAKLNNTFINIFIDISSETEGLPASIFTNIIYGGCIVDYEFSGIIYGYLFKPGSIIYRDQIGNINNKYMIKSGKLLFKRGTTSDSIRYPFDGKIYNLILPSVIYHYSIKSTNFPRANKQLYSDMVNTLIINTLCEFDGLTININNIDTSFIETIKIDDIKEIRNESTNELLGWHYNEIIFVNKSEVSPNEDSQKAEALEICKQNIKYLVYSNYQMLFNTWTRNIISQYYGPNNQYIINGEHDNIHFVTDTLTYNNVQLINSNGDQTIKVVVRPNKSNINEPISNEYLYPKYIVYINRQSDGRQIVDSITGVNE